jgi:hypothetical protein
VNNLSTFPHDWVGLTKRGGDYVIFKPCDADNAAIAIVNADGRDVVQYIWGQDASMHPITSFTTDASGRTAIAAMTEVEPQSPFTYTVEWVDSARGIALWKWQWDRGGGDGIESYAEYFTPAKNASMFATIVQPCTDCWPEEECEKMEEEL